MPVFNPEHDRAFLNKESLSVLSIEELTSPISKTRCAWWSVEIGAYRVGGETADYSSYFSTKSETAWVAIEHQGRPVPLEVDLALIDGEIGFEAGARMWGKVPLEIETSLDELNPLAFPLKLELSEIKKCQTTETVLKSKGVYIFEGTVEWVKLDSFHFPFEKWKEKFGMAPPESGLACAPGLRISKQAP